MPIQYDKTTFSRRHVVGSLGALTTLAACGGGSGSSGTSSSAASSAASSASSSSSSSSAASAASSAASSTASSAASSATSSASSSISSLSGASWLSGGTAAMTAAFPPSNVPFSDIQSAACSVSLSEFTLGPCYFDTTDQRDDISEGQTGIPMVLALKLIDSSCNPISGALIEVWWCNNAGIYSGNNSGSTGTVSNFNSSFCTGNNSVALQSKYFRGIKTTGTDGTVYFKGCYPGWYSSRTTHIHFRIVLNGTMRLISQFCFSDTLNNDIYANHSNYSSHGVNTTASNTNDTVFSSNNYQNYLLNVAPQSDRSMLAYKTIKITA